MTPVQLLKITKYSHFFKCEEISPQARPLVQGFVQRFVHRQFSRPAKADEPPPTTTYAAHTDDKREYRFHINSLHRFLEMLRINHIQETHYTITEKPIGLFNPVVMAMKAQWTLFDYQVPVVKYLVQDEGPVNRFVGIQTGKGKSLSAVKAITELNCRTLVVVKAGYTIKWHDDFIKYTDLTSDEMLVISGGKDLKAFLQLCLIEGGMDDVKVVIISNATYRIWLDHYEKYGEESLLLGYAFPPEELCERAQIGVRLVDEVHQDFHFNFRLDLYTHVKRSISLSATFISRDPFVEAMYRGMHPIDKRYKGDALDKYTKSFGVMYNIAYGRKIKTSGFKQTSYNHIEYEKSIMRNPEMFYNYSRMVKSCLDYGYLKNYVKGDKAVVFAASKDMCGKFVQVFQKWYPQLSIKRYVDEDPESNLFEPDLRFTTVLSAGTAHDIPQLTCAVLTIAIQSIQANIQVLGRLRKLKDRDTMFFFFSCYGIPKHMNYHREKVELMKERAFSYSVFPTNIEL